MRLFLDTNILIDIIEDRAEFAEDSAAVLILAEQLGANLAIAWHGLATACARHATACDRLRPAAEGRRTLSCASPSGPADPAARWAEHAWQHQAATPALARCAGLSAR